MKRRLTFKCWKCGKTYSLLRAVEEGNPILWVACPFCGQEGIVDLDPFRTTIDETYRNGSPQIITVGKTVFALPDVLPTEPVP
jgi:transcription elongation factor Elf1